jgi:hypothetical protein
MSKMAAVDAAVRLQMANDTKNVDYGAKMSTGYTTDDEMQRFLLGVANRLKLDTPSCQFDWSTVDVAKARDTTRLIIQSLIEERTKGPIDEKAKSVES